MKEKGEKEENSTPEHPKEGAALTQPAPIEGDTSSVRQRNLIFGVVNLSHLVNHVQSSMVAIIYPAMMAELGISFFQLGLLQTLYQLSAQGFQVIYGFLVRFIPRAVLLGIGNIILGLSAFATGASQNFLQVAANRTIAGAGSSAQHPVGSAILVSYYPQKKGGVLTFTHAAGNLGGFLAPAVAAALLMTGNWRIAFYVMGIPSLLLGISYFLLRDKITVAGGSKKSKVKASWEEYKFCLKNRNVLLVSLIHMTGAAGRGTGINVAFLSTFFITAYHINLAMAAVLLMIYQVGGLVGPLVIGWLSDRYSRKLVLQLSMLFSTLTTVWLLAHSGFSAALVLNLILYGSFVNSRSTLTQAMVSDAVPMSLIDTAFSVYFFIGFISGPLWTFIMGWLIDAYDFRVAFLVVSTSYLLGMIILGFTKVTATTAPGQTPKIKMSH